MWLLFAMRSTWPCAPRSGCHCSVGPVDELVPYSQSVRSDRLTLEEDVVLEECSSLDSAASLSCVLFHTGLGSSATTHHT